MPTTSKTSEFYRGYAAAGQYDKVCFQGDCVIVQCGADIIELLDCSASFIAGLLHGLYK